MLGIPLPIEVGLNETQADIFYSSASHTHELDPAWDDPEAVTDLLARATFDRNALLGLVNGAADLDELKAGLIIIIDKLLERVDALIIDIQSAPLYQE